MAAAAAWREFGIDAIHYPAESFATLQEIGDFDAPGAWPAPAPWGAGSDLNVGFEKFRSRYFTPWLKKSRRLTTLEAP